MRVRNLVVWAGLDFSLAPGDEIDLPDETAADRISAGLAEPVKPAEPAPPNPAPASTGNI